MHGKACVAAPVTLPMYAALPALPTLPPVYLAHANALARAKLPPAITQQNAPRGSVEQWSHAALGGRQERVRSLARCALDSRAALYGGAPFTPLLFAARQRRSLYLLLLLFHFDNAAVFVALRCENLQHVNQF